LNENHNGRDRVYQVQIEQFESVAESVLKYWCHEKPK
jgi:hypothetical protein